MIDLNNSTVRIYTNFNKAGEVIDKTATLTYPWFKLFWVIPITTTTQLNFKRKEIDGSMVVSCQVTDLSKHSYFSFRIKASITDKEILNATKNEVISLNYQEEEDTSTRQRVGTYPLYNT